MENSILVKFSKVIYLLNLETKYFVQSQIEVQETPVNRLPKELRLAPVGAAQIKPNAEKILLDRPVNGKHSFRTGIQKTMFENWYLGNDFEFYKGEKKISIILFHFGNDSKEIDLYYFYRYDKNSTFYRLQFANAVIPQLLKRIAA